MRRKAAVVVCSHRAEVTPWDRNGLEQCAAVLGHHDLFLVCRRGTATEEYEAVLAGLRIVPVAPRRMSSYLAYIDLETGSLLFRHFGRVYRYILCHEPDVFVFRDEFDGWCEQQYSFIGAPFFGAPPGDPDGEQVITGVGNSGFSLRDNDAHVRANRTFHLLQAPRSFRASDDAGGADEAAATAGSVRLRELPVVALKALGVGNSTNEYLRKPYLRWRGKTFYEDVYWTQMAAPLLDWFRVADPDIAMRLSFEFHPDRLFEMTDHRLPFGCNCWSRFGLEFWRPFIEAEGHVLPDAEEFPAHGSTRR